MLDLAEGWDMEEQFCKESVEVLLENRIGAAMAIWHAYTEELTKAKAKN